MRDIKYKSTSCGPSGSFQPDDVRHGVDDREAEGLVNGGYAEYLPSSAPIREQATVAPVEQAVGIGHPAIPQPQAGRNIRRGGK